MRIIDADKLTEKFLDIKSEIMNHGCYNDKEDTKCAFNHIVYLINLCIETIGLQPTVERTEKN